MREVPHGPGVVNVELLIIRLRTRAEAGCDGEDVVLLDRRRGCTKAYSALNSIDGLLFPLRIDRAVVVGADRNGDSPPRHCKLRIQLGSALERTNRLLVIEGINKTQALVKKLLRLGIARGGRVV